MTARSNRDLFGPLALDLVDVRLGEPEFRDVRFREQVEVNLPKGRQARESGP